MGVCVKIVYEGKRYAISRKVAGSITDEIIRFLIYLILPTALGHGVYSTSSINEYQKQKNNVSGVKSYVALVRERTITTERPPLFGQVSANFCGWRSVA
jgi:hypothetical protein